MLLNVTLILLFSLIFIFSSGKFVSSCTYKAVGDNVVIELSKEKLQEGSELTWIHNQTKIISKRRSKINTELVNVNQYGSLVLKNIQQNQSGKYRGEAYDKNGQSIKKTEENLCVQEPVPKPSVIFQCLGEGVNLTCSPINSNEVFVSWTKNGMELNLSRPILHVSSPELKSGDTFSCTLKNMISAKTAKDVQPVCSDPGLNTTTANEDKKRQKEENSTNKKINDDVTEKKILFGLDFQWMLVILIGGGSFLLLLFTICVVCVWRCRSRSKRKAKEEAEFRLVSLMPDSANQPDESYMQRTESQRPSKSKRPLPPLPNSRGPLAVEPQ